MESGNNKKILNENSAPSISDLKYKTQEKITNNNENNDNRLNKKNLIFYSILILILSLLSFLLYNFILRLITQNNNDKNDLGIEEGKKKRKYEEELEKIKKEFEEEKKKRKYEEELEKKKKEFEEEKKKRKYEEELEKIKKEFEEEKKKRKYEEELEKKKKVLEEEKKKRKYEEELEKIKKELEEEKKKRKEEFEINKNKYYKEINKTVVGIDFGSSKSGFAFIIFENNNKILIDEITKEIEFKDYIEKSCIIMKDNKMFEYGNKANKRMNKPISKEYIYFDRIKTNLDPKKLEKDSSNIKIKSSFPDNVEMPLKLIIQEYLKGITDDCLEIINKKGHNFTKKDINWVVTVPAIWNEYGKELMKECAIQAGMENIKIALEPEAASLLLFDDTSIDKKYKEKGKIFMLVDAGGYTIDITLNEIVDEQGNLKQLSPPSGNSFGSMKINKDILNLIQQVISEKSLKDIKKDSFDVYNNLLNQIEEIKIDANDDDSDNKDFIINLNSNSCGWFSSSKCIKRTDFGEITYDNNNIYIPKQVIKNLILKRISPIIDHIKEIYKTFNDINIDLLAIAGGFSNSNILKKEIRKYFPNAKVLKNPQISVMKGAVIYGIIPNKIISRKSPKTIGVSSYSLQRPGKECKDPEIVDGEMKCRYFDIFKRKGEDIFNNEIIEKTYTPLKEDQKDIFFILYSSNSYNPTYIDEEDVKILGSFDLEMNETNLKREERKALVRMEFGANINAYAKNKISGKEIKLKANYYNQN